MFCKFRRKIDKYLCIQLSDILEHTMIDPTLIMEKKGNLNQIILEVEAVKER